MINNIGIYLYKINFIYEWNFTIFCKVPRRRVTTVSHYLYFHAQLSHSDVKFNLRST